MADNITLTRPLWFAGVLKAVGDTVELPYGEAANLVQRGEATWISPRATAEDTTITMDQADARFMAMVGGTTDAIAEKTPNAGVTVDGVLLKDGAVNADTVNEKTPAAGVTVDGVKLKDGGVVLTTGSLQHNAVNEAGAIAVGMGSTSAEGLQTVIVDKVIDLADNVALSNAVYILPAGSVIVSVQANVQSAITGGGTTVKAGLGVDADPDQYGLSAALTQNAKITTIPDWAVLAAPTPVKLFACATNGAAGDTALTVGSVRVRMVYLSAVNLIDAAA